MPQILVNKRPLWAWPLDMLAIVMMANLSVRWSFLARLDLAYALTFLLACAGSAAVYYAVTAVLIKASLDQVVAFLISDPRYRTVLYLLLLLMIMGTILSFSWPLHTLGPPLEHVPLSLSPDRAQAQGEQDTHSYRLGLKGRALEQWELNWPLFPGFELVRKSNRSVITPYLRLRARNDHVVVGLHRRHQVNWSSFKDTYLGQAPLAQQLSAILKYGRLNSWGEFLSSPMGRVAWLFADNHQVKRELLKLLQMPDAHSFFVTKLFEQDHLFVVSHPSSVTQSRYVRWLNLEQGRPHVFELLWRGAGDDLYRVLLQFVASHFTSVPMEKRTSYPQQFFVFELMDLVVDPELSLADKERGEEALLAFYRDRLARAFKRNVRHDIEVLQQELEHVNRVIAIKKKSWNPIFNMRWETMVQAALRENRKHFRVKD